MVLEFPQDRTDWFWVRLVNQLSSFFRSLWRRKGPNYFPEIRLQDAGSEWVIEGNFLGWSEPEIEVKVLANRVTIRGARYETATRQQRGWFGWRRQMRSFERHFILKEKVQPESFHQTMQENGLFTLTLPKTPEALNES